MGHRVARSEAEIKTACWTHSQPCSPTLEFLSLGSPSCGSPGTELVCRGELTAATLPLPWLRKALRSNTGPLRDTWSPKNHSAGHRCPLPARYGSPDVTAGTEALVAQSLCTDEKTMVRSHSEGVDKGGFRASVLRLPSL